MHVNQTKSATTGADFRNGMVKRVKLRQRAKFRGDRSNRRRDMAIFQLFKMAVAAIMDGRPFGHRHGPKSGDCCAPFWGAKFGWNPLNRGRDMAIFQFFKMAADRLLGFAMCVFGPPTKGIWYCAKIWLESMQ